MIHIITPGRKFYKKTCIVCDCCFLFEEEDILETEINDQGPFSHMKYEVECPCCDTKLRVDRNMDMISHIAAKELRCNCDDQNN